MPVELDDTSINIIKDGNTVPIEFAKSTGFRSVPSTDYSVYGVGDNQNYQLGYSNTGNQLTPRYLNWFSDNSIVISQIVCGSHYTMFLTDNGNVYGVGNNGYYQLGYSSNGDPLTPIHLSWFREGGNNITISQIACGARHSMFLTDDGNVYGIGENRRYQLGYSSSTSSQSTPIHLSWFREGGNNITISQIACGSSHTMFLTDDGNVYGVGRNSHYQLGYSSSTGNQSTPRYLSWFREGGNNITISQIACGRFYTMFLTDDGNVYGVGDNSYYQLGYSSSASNQSTPRYLSWFREGGNNITISQIVCGYYYTMFLTDDDNIYGVGANYSYQLGYSSSTSSQSTPRHLSWFHEGGNNITISQIACGDYHTMFLTDDGNVYGVGNNGSYQLGYSSTGNQSTPRHLNWFYEDGNNITISQIACGQLHTMFLSGENNYNGVEYVAQWSYSSDNPNVHTYSNVGIGATASETFKLNVRGDLNVIGNIYIDGNVISNYWTKTADNNLYILNKNVGVGKTDPQYSLDTSGTIFSKYGGITATGNNTWAVASDRRIKENIVLADYNKCAENIKSIELYRYKYKSFIINADDKNQLGFIAQNVMNYYPKAVKSYKYKLNKNDTIDLLSVDITQINYSMFGAIKHIESEIIAIKEYLGITEEQSQENAVMYNSN